MIEQLFKLSITNNKTIEKVIADENIHYNHMILNKGEALPEHYSNSTLYMNVIRGKLSLGLDNQPINNYEIGSLLKIPEGVKMNVQNLHDDVLEITVVKAPAPKI